MSVLWGMPYLFIKEAVASFTPAAVVAGRTTVGALLLLPVALRKGALRPALAHWRWVLAFGAIEMAGPFLLLSYAEQTLPSGLTGLLVATVPLFGAVTAFLLGDRLALKPKRLFGLVVGLAGVAVIVTGSNGDGQVDPVNVGIVLLVAVLYSIAPFVVARKLGPVPGIGVAALALAAVATAYLPVALLTQHETPTGRSILALGGLSVICTTVAFLVFFALIDEVGPAQATVFTYVNPVVALTLGIVVLGETLTTGLVVGFPIVLLGCWLAASRRDEDPMMVAEP